MITNRIAAWSEAQAKQRGTPKKIGAWNVGNCVRQLWYICHGTQGEPREARSGQIFALGDAVEDTAFTLAANAGVSFIRTNKPDYWRDISSYTRMLEPVGRLRPDGLIIVEEDEKALVLQPNGVRIFRQLSDLALVGKTIPLEIKSDSNFGFDAVKAGEIDEYELCQGECYIRALEELWWSEKFPELTFSTDYWLHLSMRKETGHMFETLVQRSDERWERIKAAVATAHGEALPARPYTLRTACEGCDGRGTTLHATPRKHEPCRGTGRAKGGPFLPSFPCGYCQFKKTCWESEGEIEIVLEKGRHGDRPTFRLDTTAKDMERSLGRIG